MNIPFILDPTLAWWLFAGVMGVTALLLIWQRDTSVIQFVGLIAACALAGWIGIHTHVLILLILFASVGVLVAFMGRDELIMGRPWFKLAFWVAFLGAGILLVLSEFLFAIAVLGIVVISGEAYALSSWKRLTRYPTSD